VCVGSLLDYELFAPDYSDNKTGMTAAQRLDAIYAQTALLNALRDEYFRAVTAELAQYGVCHMKMSELCASECRVVEKHFVRNILPQLSPQVIDSRHPFPHLANKQLHIAAILEHKSMLRLGMIAVPQTLSRVYYMLGACNYVLLEDVIEKLVEAAQSGVKIPMIVLRICCVILDVEGFTENISVIGIVGQFLEHSRIFCFGVGDEKQLYTSSADLMTRNTERRIAALNHFDYMATLTLDRKRIERENPAVVSRKLRKWLDNATQRKGLAYVLVPELHKDGKGIHLFTCTDCFAAPYGSKTAVNDARARWYTICLNGNTDIRLR